jgi:predicted choloylglycine hydrolase
MMSGVLYDFSDALGWVPMWGEYADEVIEDYLEAYGLLVEDLELLKSAYRHDNMNCECVGQRLLTLLFSQTFLIFSISVWLKKKGATELWRNASWEPCVVQARIEPFTFQPIVPLLCVTSKKLWAKLATLFLQYTF